MVSLLISGLVSVASIVITTVIQVIVFKAMAKLSLLSSKSSILSIKSSLLSFLSPSPAPSFSYYGAPLLPGDLQAINNIPLSYPNYHFHRHDHYHQVSALLSTINLTSILKETYLQDHQNHFRSYNKYSDQYRAHPFHTSAAQQFSTRNGREE